MRLLIDVPERGAQELALYAQAMARELTDNAHKGHWLQTEDGGERQRTPLELFSDLLYHVIKLGLASIVDDKEAVQEYAADVGNCAWFLADHHGALAVEPTHVGPIEYDDEHMEHVQPADFAEYKRIAHEWAGGILADKPILKADASPSGTPPTS